MALFKRKQEQKTAEDESSRTTLAATLAAPAFNPYIDELAEHYKTRLLRETNLERLTSLGSQEMRVAIERLVSQYMSEEKVVIPRSEKELLLTRLINESVGLGPLEPLLADPEITEISINGHNLVYIEKRGRLELTDLKFRDEEHLRHIVDRIVAPLGRRIDESSPMVDARLKDGSRVNAVIPPISLNGTLVSIRKFRKEPYLMDDLQQFGSFDEAMSCYIQAVVEAKMNVLISGGTGSGKTTLLNAAARAIPHYERIITIEDSAELKLTHPNCVGLEARPPNMEGKGEITIRQLVRNSLRMRPDRIIVGEVRGAEAFDMLQAMNTGHEGSLTTVHANSPLDAFNRLEGMVVMAGMDLPSAIVREYIVSALDIIVQVMRLSDGTRKIVSISEVAKSEDKRVEVQEIFRFHRTGIGSKGEVLGYFTPTGIIPRSLERFKVFGIELDESMFTAKGGGRREPSYSV
ncbi:MULTISPECIES: CpaF family protein [Brevibacillus]|jgi:pilus assembly protein CpaF|uniref:Type II secretion system protein E n=1 Tax=Brevibacillus parabrevis TaxID=54914 RepID=A0A4Y3PQ84_BREPA|nr:MULTISPECIES: CpaF family protein [Brevibacillus]MDH6351995.1 pilus assembly protein CpaF [Brevibacillus sp. 1238]MDR4999727.1 CpaF family protein [Brevibacillus parabrevis]MED2257057.1 CpaF family protein [Brevibacillus parabrevis]NRQ56228.1 CpaF family protein [Brevibacillus sp. HD1.4A]RNB93842.1 CpaF family protein [Brevibacillus parabrevis]